MPIYGVECQDALAITPPPSGVYSKGAVIFNSAVLELGSAVCTDNAFWGWAFWYKTSWSAHQGGDIVFVVDPLNNYNNHLGALGSGTAGRYTDFSAEVPGSDREVEWAAPTSAAWHHQIGAVNTQTGTVVVYDDDAQATLTNTSNATGFDNQTNGLPLWVGSDFLTGTDFFVGSMADLSIWAGVDLLQGGTDIPVGIRRLFVTASAAASVDPTVASGLIATLGNPTIFLTGDSSMFADNHLGSNAALTLATGSLSNDTSSRP